MVLDELRTRADAGDEHAAHVLARLLTALFNVDLDEASQILRTRADAGNSHAARRLARLLAGLLARQGRGEEATRLRRFGLNPDGSTACK